MHISTTAYPVGVNVVAVGVRLAAVDLGQIGAVAALAAEHSCDRFALLVLVAVVLAQRLLVRRRTRHARCSGAVVQPVEENTPVVISLPASFKPLKFASNFIIKIDQICKFDIWIITKKIWMAENTEPNILKYTIFASLTNQIISIFYLA